MTNFNTSTTTISTNHYTAAKNALDLAFGNSQNTMARSPAATLAASKIIAEPTSVTKAKVIASTYAGIDSDRFLAAVMVAKHDELIYQLTSKAVLAILMDALKANKRINYQLLVLLDTVVREMVIIKIASLPARVLVDECLIQDIIHQTVDEETAQLREMWGV